MRNVDAICDDLKKRESAINLLFFRNGTLQRGMSESPSDQSRYTAMRDNDCAPQKWKAEGQCAAIIGSLVNFVVDIRYFLASGLRQRCGQEVPHLA